VADAAAAVSGLWSKLLSDLAAKAAKAKADLAAPVATSGFMAPAAG